MIMYIIWQSKYSPKHLFILKQIIYLRIHTYARTTCEAPAALKDKREYEKGVILYVRSKTYLLGKNEKNTHGGQLFYVCGVRRHN